jgi:hypothetical protein
MTPAQPTPDVGEADVRRVLKRDYPPEVQEELWGIIERLEVIEKWRVVLGCLKTGGGSVDKLRYQLKDATGYYREILGEAEYPLATKRWFHIEKLTDAEREAIYDKDWKQYQEWLARP